MVSTETKPKSKTHVHHHNGKGNGIVIDGNGHSSSKDNVVINLNHGDPKMYIPFWKRVDDECSITIKASDTISYFVNPKEGDFVFQMPEFTDAIRRVHRIVGNAVTEGRYIIGGTGSSQLMIVALRALASTANATNKKKRIPVVCAEPYYSGYGEAIEEEKSEMFEWCGDANKFKEDKGPYIEIVTSPNNPDGRCQKPVVNREEGSVVYDLAYYWPQYTPITAPADYDVMLFTLSKSTGHAGSRTGWAIVKDATVATKMMRSVALMSIGTCQEGQLRATKILNFTADSYEYAANSNKPFEGLFEYGHRVMANRWEKLRAIAKHTGAFSLQDVPSAYCNYLGKVTHATPGFAWIECKTGDAAQLIAKLKIRARSGAQFGANVPKKYVRVSIMGSDDDFNLFLERLSNMFVLM